MQACIVRQIRESSSRASPRSIRCSTFRSASIARYRAEATQLLGNPQDYPFAGRGCGGDVPAGGLPFAQETRIGRYAE
jgi:hypothetical protein